MRVLKNEGRHESKKQKTKRERVETKRNERNIK